MKIHKPLNISFLYKVFEANKAFYFCGAMLCMFPFRRSNRLFTDPEIWKFAAKQLGKNAALDMVMPKPNGEVLVTGKCHAGRDKVTARNVQLRLGAIDKTLTVFGDRRWMKKGELVVGISDPEPFESMDITYQNAFGGQGYALNPVGKGAVELHDDKGQACHPLPNIETARCLIGAVDDRPVPAGFGPLDMTWPQRMSRAGTYDRKWLQDLFPGLAADTDMRFFNLGPEDQWLKGFFQGDESFAVEGMHAEKDVVVGKLPGLSTRMFLLRQENGETTFQEIETNMDTLWLFPHVERGIAIHHGVTQITSDDAEDVLHAIVGYERLDDSPRPMEHYREALDKRLDKKKRSYYNLYDKDLIPHGESSGWADLMKIDPENRGPLAANMTRRGELEKQKALDKRDTLVAEAKKSLEAAGLDPSLLEIPTLPEEEPDGSGQELTEFDPEKLAKIAADARKNAGEQMNGAILRAKEKKETFLAEMKELCASHGLDFDEMMGKDKEEKLVSKRPIRYAASLLATITDMKQQMDAQFQELANQGSPSLEELLKAAGVASDELAAFEEMQKQMQGMDPNNPDLIKKLQAIELATKASYRKTAHNSFQLASLTPEQADELLQKFESLKEKGESFNEVDLAGIDLRGRDLSGLNLAGAYLEHANLNGADLSGADLTKAVLAHADLSHAKIHQGVLSNANLGKAKLQQADFTQSKLNGVVLDGTDLSQTVFKDCQLNRLQLLEKVELDRTDFSGASLKKAMFIKTTMKGVSFRGTNLFKATLVNCRMEGVDFSDAKAQSASIIGLKAPQLDCTRTDFTRTAFLNKTDLRGALFHKAILERVNFMDARLENATLIEAKLNQANFMNADMRQARLTGAVARNANFTKADLEQALLVGIDLMYANLRGARLTGADLRHANLYSAEVLRAVFGQTRVEGANLKMTKIRDWDGDTI